MLNYRSATSRARVSYERIPVTVVDLDQHSNEPQQNYRAYVDNLSCSNLIVHGPKMAHAGTKMLVVVKLRNGLTYVIGCRAVRCEYTTELKHAITVEFSSSGYSRFVEDWMKANGYEVWLPAINHERNKVYE